MIGLNKHSRRKALHLLLVCAQIWMIVGSVTLATVQPKLPEPLAALQPLIGTAKVAQAAGTVTGTVFQDFDADGIDDGANELGVGGVTVTAYDADGSQCGQTTSSTATATLGQYTLSHTCTAATVRVEFTGLPSGYQSGPRGTTSGTSVQFVGANASSVHFGVNAPADYVDATPFLASARYYHKISGFQTLLSWNYNNRGLLTAGGYVAPTGEATVDEIGTTWGLAYRRSTKDLFAAAFVRRHGSIPDVVASNGLTTAASDSVVDLGVIYRVTQDGNTANNSNVRWVNLDGATDAASNTIDVGTLGADSARGINTTGPSNDPTAFDAVGKQGLGDVDISDDESNLWVTNLNERKLHAIAIQADGTAGTIRSFDIPTAQCNGAGAANDTRPFATKYYRGAVYVGVVCSGENTQTLASMNAYVFRLPDDGATTTFTQVLTFSLGYARQSGDSNTGCVNIQNWQPWRTTIPAACINNRTVAPQPLLSDIEFDSNGDMIVGLLDRYGHQASANNYGLSGSTVIDVVSAGDILRAPRQSSTLFNIETTATDVSITTEYYGGDAFTDTGNGSGHFEITVGGLALIPGNGKVVSTAFDPINGTGAQGVFNAGGVIFLDNTTGARTGTTDGYQVYNENTTGTVGKAAGMGDLELLSDPAPIEIGNRVWLDANSNGVQDPGENGIQNITVELYKAGVKVGQATTDANGNYYFTSGTSATDSNTNDNVIHDGGVGIRPATGTAGGNSEYEVRIPNIAGGSKQAALGVNVLTLADNGGATNGDLRDSDGAVSGVNASYVIPYADLQGAGYNSHTYDFGFAPSGTIQIVKNTVGNNGTFDFTSADSDLNAVSITTVSNTGNSGTAFTKIVGSYTLSEDAPPANWALTSLACTGDSDNGSVVTLASRQVAIDLDANENIICTFTNTYTPPPGAIQVTKQIVTTDGSSPTVSGAFTINVSCPGSTPTPSASQTVAAGGSVTFGNIAAGTVCTVSENMQTLPTAPSGYTWVNSQVTPASVTVVSNQTAAVTARNTLAPQPTPPTGVLTITKTISGTGSGPFNITVTGPGGYVNNTTISPGTPVVLTGLASGIYTVTEQSPGAGWTTVYSVSNGMATATNAVVNLSNPNPVTPVTPAAISGNVYRDFDADGVDDGTNEPGVAGVTVTAYDRNGNACGSTTSGSTGAYSFTPTCSGPWRLEFTNLSAGYEPSNSGAGNGTNTQFVSSAPTTNVNFAVNYPSDYCQNNPKLCTPVYVNGNASTTNPAMYSLNFDGTSQATIAQQVQIGTTWGLAYKRGTNQLFAAAAVKRHAGLGSQGLGGIYVITNPATTPAVSNFMDLDAAPYNIDFGPLGDNTARGLPAGATVANRDSAAYAAVGTQGIGDIDLSDDGSTLWAVNLYTATGNLAALIEIDVTGGTAPSSVTVHPLSAMSGVPTCTSGRLRPWALKIFHGVGYLGAVCSAEISNSAANLEAYVVSFNPQNPSALTTELHFPLTYIKGEVNNGAWTGDNIWNPWLTTYAAAQYLTLGPFANPAGGTRTFHARATPVLADIEFDASGTMILGFYDRSGMQLGAGNQTPDTNTSLVAVQTAGDILRACPDNTGAFVLENNGVCGGITGVGSAGEGPGGKEFYLDNSIGSTANHEDPINGGLAQIPGNVEVAVTYMDPTGNFDSGGVVWLNNSNGARSRGTQLYAGGNAIDSFGQASNGFFGKATGVGDIEVLCDAAPIEIGNRVWNDLNGNGVQDPGEPGLANLTVSRQGPTNTVQTTTDSSGLYYFGNLKANTAYTLTMNVPSGYSVTAANAQALSGASVSSNHAISDTRDSDAVLVGGLATVYYTTGSAGQNNHGLDFGFTQPVSGRVGITNIAPPVADLSISKAVTPITYTQGMATNVTFVFTVTNHGPADVTGAIITDTAPANATFGNWSCVIVTAGAGSVSNSCGAASGNGNINTTATLRSGAQARFMVPATLSAAATGVIVNTAYEKLPGTITQDPTTNRPDNAAASVTPLITSYALRKQLLTPDPVRVGDDITFTIRITNTGSVVIDVLPLRDLYNPADILFNHANVPPDDSINDGQLDWSDLTVSFGQNLAPNQSFTVTTVFVARRDTTLLPGAATNNIARVLITPTQTVTTPVRIEAPTLVELASHSATYADGQVTLVWATSSEVEASGFNVLRQTVDPTARPEGTRAANADWVKLNEQLIAAQQPGQATGASYRYTDANVTQGQNYRYVLEILDTSGVSAYRELGTVTTGGSALYLPVVSR